MSTIDFDSFMTFCKGREGRTLPTVGGRKQFVLSLVEEDCLHYIPVTSGIQRDSHSKKYIERILNRYAMTDSLRPGGYRDISRNASYTLELIKLYTGR